MEFYQCVTKCCSGYNHPTKFWLAPISEPPLKISLDDFTRVHFVSSCNYIHPICLFIAFKSLHVDVQVMLATMFWLCSKSSLHMCLLCFPWKHLLHSHTESHSLPLKRCLSQWTINHECRVCRLHHRSVMLNMCVWMVRLFRCQIMRVCVHMTIYAPFDCSHT